jgi:hypothetical protein
MPQSEDLISDLLRAGNRVFSGTNLCWGEGYSMASIKAMSELPTSCLRIEHI